jgi:o-succinylbenzoate synthase
VKIKLIRARLRAPFVSALGSVSVRELLLLALEDREGNVGYGEAAPLPIYDGVQLEHAQAALEDCRHTLADGDGRDRREVLEECSARAVLPQAVAAVDLALWDLEGRRRRLPVWRLLGASAAAPVEVNFTLDATDRAGAAREADAARAAGFRCVKAKVAVGDDAGRIAAVRAAAGPAVAIRLDANGAWSIEEALAALRALAPAGIELCEEPVRGLEQIGLLSKQTHIPLAIDESAAAPGALDRRICHAMCLKIARCGGISGVLEAARSARAVGYELYLASTLDGPLAIAAALHLAAAIAPSRPCGLATLGLFADRRDPLPVQAGRIAAPAGAGLGDGLLSWYDRSV